MLVLFLGTFKYIFPYFFLPNNECRRDFRSTQSALGIFRALLMGGWACHAIVTIVLAVLQAQLTLWYLNHWGHLDLHSNGQEERRGCEKAPSDHGSRYVLAEAYNVDKPQLWAQQLRPCWIWAKQTFSVSFGRLPDGGITTISHTLTQNPPPTRTVPTGSQFFQPRCHLCHSILPPIQQSTRRRLSATPSTNYSREFKSSSIIWLPLDFCASDTLKWNSEHHALTLLPTFGIDQYADFFKWLLDAPLQWCLPWCPLTTTTLVFPELDMGRMAYWWCGMLARWVRYILRPLSISNPPPQRIFQCILTALALTNTQCSLNSLPQFTHTIVSITLGQDHTLALTKWGKVLISGLIRFS